MTTLRLLRPLLQWLAPPPVAVPRAAATTRPAPRLHVLWTGSQLLPIPLNRGDPPNFDPTR